MELSKIRNFLLLIKVSFVGILEPLYGILAMLSQYLDKRFLFTSLGVVVFLYSGLFAYSYLSASSLIKDLENSLASEITPVDIIHKQETKQQVGGKNETKENTNTTDNESIALIDGLSEFTPDGKKLPIIRASDNLTSFQAYRRSFSFGEFDNSKPVVSFLLIDYGLSQKQSEYALDILPPEVSFMLSPYSNLPDEWANMARARGHEVWLNVPIQNNKQENSGKNTVFHHASVKQKQRSMRKSLILAEGYLGVGSYTDDSMNVVAEDYLTLIGEIYNRGLGYVEVNPEAPLLIRDKAFSMFAPYIRADLKIVRMRGKNGSFEKLEAIANEKGYAVAVIPSYPNTIKNLAVWLLKVAKSDYSVIPVSAVYDLPLYQSIDSN